MNLSQLSLVILCLSVYLSPFLLSAGPDDYSYSRKRIKRIEEIVKSFADAGENTQAQTVQNAIFRDVNAEFPAPKTPADTRDIKELAEEVRKEVSAKFPVPTEQYRKTVEAEAEKRFYMSNLMDNVTVRYQRGEKTFTVEGVFYSYGGNSIKVGDNYIAILDLLHDSRIRFDKNYCEQEKQKFIDNKLQADQAKRADYYGEVFAKLRNEQTQKNEAAGYVWSGKEWRTPKKIAELCLITINGGKTVVKNDPPASTPTTPPSTPTPTPPPTPGAGPKTSNVPSDLDANKNGNAKVVEELEKRVEERLKLISSTCSGIDSDQGYKKAFWGFSRAEAKLLLASENPVDSGDSMVIKYNEGAVDSASLLFHKGYFYKVVIRFRISTPTVMAEIARSMQNRYGLTDEEKALRNEEKIDDAEKAPDDKKKDDKKKDDKKKDDKKKDDKKPEDSIPLEEQYRWSGKVTKGTIIVKRTPDRKSYAEFSLTKESTDVVEKVNELVKQEELRKAHEKSQREIENVKDTKIEF